MRPPMPCPNDDCVNRNKYEDCEHLVFVLFPVDGCRFYHPVDEREAPSWWKQVAFDHLLAATDSKVSEGVFTQMRSQIEQSTRTRG